MTVNTMIPATLKQTYEALADGLDALDQAMDVILAGGSKVDHDRLIVEARLKVDRALETMMLVKFPD